MIIEAKKNDSLHKVLRNDLLNPNQLGNTYMEVFEPYPNAIAHNWITATLNPALAVDSSSTPHTALWSSVEPQGGYFSDAADLVKWGYNLYSGKVISQTSLNEMLTFTNVNGSSYFNGYGLGAQRFPYNGKTYYGHGGNYYGYAASMLYYPQDSICVAVLINQDCIATYEARTLMDVLIKKIATSVKDEIPGDKISVKPNPADNELTITIEGKYNKAQIVISDASGREVLTTLQSSPLLTINTAGFSAGTYFVNITTENNITTKKVIICH